MGELDRFLWATMGAAPHQQTLQFPDTKCDSRLKLLPLADNLSGAALLDLKLFIAPRTSHGLPRPRPPPQFLAGLAALAPRRAASGQSELGEARRGKDKIRGKKRGAGIHGIPAALDTRARLPRLPRPPSPTPITRRPIGRSGRRRAARHFVSSSIKPPCAPAAKSGHFSNPRISWRADSSYSTSKSIVLCGTEAWNQAGTPAGRPQSGAQSGPVGCPVGEPAGAGRRAGVAEVGRR